MFSTKRTASITYQIWLLPPRKCTSPLLMMINCCRKDQFVFAASCSKGHIFVASAVPQNHTSWKMKLKLKWHCLN